MLNGEHLLQHKIVYFTLIYLLTKYPYRYGHRDISSMYRIDIVTKSKSDSKASLMFVHTMLNLIYDCNMHPSS